MEINQEKRAFYAWEILTSYATSKKTITYGGLGTLMSIHHRAVRFVLDKIYNYCLSNNLPLLTIIILNKVTGLPGDGFKDYSVDTFEDDLAEIFNFKWIEIENPFEFASDGTEEFRLVETLVDTPDKSQDVYAKVKVRGIAQVIFRKALLKVYNCSCAICGFSYENALEASHIIPYGKCNSTQRLDVRNGLLLCSIHHKLFDLRYLTITETYLIKYMGINKVSGLHSEYDKLLVENFHNKKLCLPSNKKHYPSITYLKERAEVM